MERSWARHFEREGAVLVDLGDGLVEGVDAKFEECVVAADHTDAGGGEGTPVVVVVAFGAGFFKADQLAGGGVKPEGDGLELGYRQCGVSDEDGQGDAGGAEGPLGLEPGLGVAVDGGIIVHEGVGGGPGVELIECAFGFSVRAGGDVLIHACGDAVFEVVIDFGGLGFGGIDGAV